jgi:hypothetical protein
MKYLTSIYEFNNNIIILDKNSTNEDKENVFNFLKENVHRFMNRKNTNETLNNFLNKNNISIKIDEELNYKNIFDFLNNTTYEDCHCHNVGCDNETKFTGFYSFKYYPRGYKQFCSKKCMSEWFSNKQKGKNNTFHRMNKDKIPEFKNKMSFLMKDMIETGKFKPKAYNSWRNIKYSLVINNDVINFRSSWEAFFNLVNPELKYETRRIIYYHKNVKHIYIVDFDDIENRILYEIKPTSQEKLEKNIDKIKYVSDWCENNNYRFKIINDEWFKINYPIYKNKLENQPEKDRIIKNLRRYENKKNI